MQIARKQKITAADFNKVVNGYGVIWSNIPAQNTFNFSWSDANKNLDQTDVFVSPATPDEPAPASRNHSFGWGQSEGPPVVVAQKEKIAAEHINTLIAQVNAGLYHQDTAYSLLNKYLAKTSITAENVNLVLAEIDRIKTDRFRLNDASDLVVVESETESCSWTNQLRTTVKFTFQDYTQARHFFNSGGKLLIEMDAVPNAMCPEATFWEDSLRQLGTVYIGALSTTRTGTETYDWPDRAPWFGGSGQLTSGKGFYNINHLGQQTLLMTFQGYSRDLYSAYNSYNAYNNPYNAYNSYNSSAYSVRAMEIWGQVIDNGPGDFSIYLQVRLYEAPGFLNAESDGLIQAEFTMDAGYVQPLTAPPGTLFLSSGGDAFKPTLASAPFQFLERAAPSVTISQTWQSIT
jgi:hypothetical protein